jgi:hypothetical protein
MPGPHDPDHTSSAGLVLRDAGEETGNRMSAKEEDTVKGSRAPTRFWMVTAALLVGVVTLALGFIFFSTWPGVLAVEVIGAGLALLATGILLTGAWRASAQPTSPSATEALDDRPAEPAPAVALVSPDSAPSIPAVTALEPPAAPASAPAPEQPEASAAAPEVPLAPPTALEAPPIPARKPTRPKASLPPQNGHTAAEASRPRPRARDDTLLPRPPLTNLPQRYPRPSGGYSIDAEAEDLSQLLGDVAEQTVIAIATRGQRGVERRERMASKIDAFSQEMAADPHFAPVVAYLESISALLRAGQPIPAPKALVDPFDELYGYVLTLIRRKTGKTHD